MRALFKMRPLDNDRPLDDYRALYHGLTDWMEPEIEVVVAQLEKLRIQGAIFGNLPGSLFLGAFGDRAAHRADAAANLLE